MSKTRQPPTPSLESLRVAFCAIHQYRDAMRPVHVQGVALSPDILCEIAWESGYEGDSWKVCFAPYYLLFVDSCDAMRAEYERGSQEKP